MWALSVEDIRHVTRNGPPINGDVPVDVDILLEAIEDPSEIKGWALRNSRNMLWIPWELFKSQVLPKLGMRGDIPRFNAELGDVEFLAGEKAWSRR